jgi:hypothetical protein
LKKTINILILLVAIFSVYTCKEKKEEKVIFNENNLIKDLSTNDFYKNFLIYNIRTPREKGQYMIETDSIKEFWVNFDKEKGITISNEDEIHFDKELKSIYSNKYYEIKKVILFNLNKLISFMVTCKITNVVNFSSKRIDFYLENNSTISRFDNTVTRQSVLNNLRRYYDTVIEVDSNWAILKNEKLPQQSSVPWR